MVTEFGFTDEHSNTQYAPLAALSVLYQQNQVFRPLEQVQKLTKERDFGLNSKLLQVLLSILAGCETLSEVNPKLSSETGLASLWGWERFADQSTLSRTLDQLSLKQIDQLRQATTQTWRSFSRTHRHNWHGFLWLDYDLSGLPCSAKAEASQKGFFSDKKMLLDVNWRGSVWSDVFPGNYHTVHCLQPAVQAAEIALELASSQRERTVWRLDGGAGSEQQLRWLVERGYQVMAKGMNHHRACALAKQVSRWDAYGDDWLGEAPAPTDYARPVRVFVKKRLKDGALQYSYFVTTLSFPSKGHFLACYDARGAAEVEQFRNDKGGLGLQARRKRNFLGQIGYVLLTDLAHNLLADFYHRALLGSKFETYGPKRIVRDLLNTPGRLVFEAGVLKRIELLSLKQNAEDLRMCLVRYCTS